MNAKAIWSKHEDFGLLAFQQCSIHVLLLNTCLHVPCLNDLLKQLYGLGADIHGLLCFKDFILFRHQIFDVAQFLSWFIKVLEMTRNWHALLIILVGLFWWCVWLKLVVLVTSIWLVGLIRHWCLIVVILLLAISVLIRVILRIATLILIVILILLVVSAASSCVLLISTAISSFLIGKVMHLFITLLLWWNHIVSLLWFFVVSFLVFALLFWDVWLLLLLLHDYKKSFIYFY